MNKCKAMKILYFHLDSGMTERNEMELNTKIDTGILKIRTASFDLFDEFLATQFEFEDKPKMIIFARSVSQEQIMGVLTRWRENPIWKQNPVYTIWIGSPTKSLLVDETIPSIEEWDAKKFLSKHSKVA